MIPTSASPLIRILVYPTPNMFWTQHLDFALHLSLWFSPPRETVSPHMQLFKSEAWEWILTSCSVKPANGGSCWFRLQSLSQIHSFAILPPILHRSFHLQASATVFLCLLPPTVPGVLCCLCSEATLYPPLCVVRAAFCTYYFWIFHYLFPLITPV